MKNNIILDFNTNINPFGPPKWIYGRLNKNRSLPIEYPDYKNIELNQQISKFLNLPIENVAVANGSLEVIFAIPRILNAIKICIIKPTYWGYAASVDSIDKKPSFIILSEKNNFKLNLLELDQCAKKSSLIFLCNPNNPTGTFIRKKDLLPIIERNKNCHFFVDEAHLILKNEYKKETLAQNVLKLKNLSIIYSTSKLYNLGGLRTGIFVSNNDIIEKFKKFQIPYSTNNITQKIFTELLKDNDFINVSIKEIKEATKDLISNLQRIKWLKIYKTKTHFVLAKIITRSITAINLANRLKNDGFGIRECTTSYDNLPGEWIRISSNTKKNNKLLVDKILSYKIS